VIVTTWKTLYDKIIVRRAPAATHLAGFEVPEAHREKQNIGTVVTVGAGRFTSSGELVPLVVAAGDEVLFNKFAGVPLEGEDPDLLVLREDEILAYRRLDV
jgi:chaperonin GroES